MPTPGAIHLVNYFALNRKKFPGQIRLSYIQSNNIHLTNLYFISTTPLVRAGLRNIKGIFTSGYFPFGSIGSGRQYSKNRSVVRRFLPWIEKIKSFLGGILIPMWRFLARRQFISRLSHCPLRSILQASSLARCRLRPSLDDDASAAVKIMLKSRKPPAAVIEPSVVGGRRR